MTLAGATLNGKARRAALSGTRLAYSTQGRLPAWDLNDAARFSSGGARRRPTDSEAVNGNRAVGLVPRFLGRNSPQPSHYFTGNTADGLEPGTDHSGFIAPRSSLTVPKLGGAGGVHRPSAPSFFFKIVNHTHSISPVLSIASENMEKSVSEVCTKEFGALSASDIERAREIHQRLVVRMMTAPGDSKGAMYRIEAAYGLSYHCQFNLRHQNRASGEFIARLHAVWLAVLEQSVRRDVAELLAEREKREVA